MANCKRPYEHSSSLRRKFGSFKMLSEFLESRFNETDRDDFQFMCMLAEIAASCKLWDLLGLEKPGIPKNRMTLMEEVSQTQVFELVNNLAARLDVERKKGDVWVDLLGFDRKQVEVEQEDVVWIAGPK